MSHLFLFQIGPVQTFIAASRRTQDLYVGSRLLSEIALAGVKAAEQAGGSLVFPVKNGESYPQSISHIFA
ncbi:MAG: type III-B CRISPR-associated protein Cas10/Cmr2, partial [Phototrophicales bacterium]